MLKEVFLLALRTAIKTTLWLLKIMLPVTLLVTICNYYGWIEDISVYAAPLFSLMGMEGEAAIPFITSILTNLYAAIAVMASLGLDFRTVTILASMCLIAHNLIVECKIQQKAGSPIAFIAPLRIFTALITGYLLNMIIPADMSGKLFFPTVDEAYQSLGDLFLGWLRSSLMLAIQIFTIVFFMNAFQNILRHYNIIDKLQYLLRPVMSALLLPRSVSILWTISNTLGLTYGGMAIVEELDSGEVTIGESRLMNSSIAITHSLIEDSFLFVAIGVGALWVFIPRVIMSIVVVALHRVVKLYFKPKFL